MRRMRMLAIGGAIALASGAGLQAVSVSAAEKRAEPTSFATEKVGEVSFGPDTAPPDLPAALAGVAGQLAEIVDDHDNEFSASWYDPETNTIAVGVVTDKGHELLAKSGVLEDSKSVDVRTAEASHKTLMTSIRKAIDSSGRLDRKAVMWGVATDGSGVFVKASEMLDERQIGALDAAVDVPVSVVKTDQLDSAPAESRLQDDSPYEGGARYGMAANGAALSSRCSTGFGYRDGDEYSLTAGHCFESGTTIDRMWQIVGPNAGPWAKGQYMAHFGGRTTWNNGTGTFLTSDGEFHGDLSTANITDQGGLVGSKIWVGGVTGATKLSVVTRHSPVIGEYVCRSGASSGEQCGLRTNGINVDWTYTNGDIVRDGDTATRAAGNCIVGGDSGGSVYTYSGSTQINAVGIVSGGNAAANCVLVFTGTEEASQLWGGNLDYL